MNNSENESARESTRDFINTYLDKRLSFEEIREKGRILNDTVILEEIIQEIIKKRDDIIHLPIPQSIRGNTLKGWYDGPKKGDLFWPNYKDYLLSEKNFSREILDSINNATNKIVSHLGDPTKEFNLRGLVVGYVQSGKTANYTGVIAKAADAGYKLFVILTSSNKKLRRQTQQRLEKDLINQNSQRWFPLTAANSDFSSNISNPNAYLTKIFQSSEKISKDLDKTICIMKKYPSRLQNFLNFLNNASPEILEKTPVLLIDDEADQASVNTKNPKDRSKINYLIIEILNKLKKVSYVGYTATPFANVLIDPSFTEGLYPRDFIFSLPKPKRYFGTEKIFGRESLRYDDPEEPIEGGLDVIRIVPADEVNLLKPNKKEKDSFSPQITKSLEEAIKYFWISTAAKFARGHTSTHSTMLIHTTSLINPQNKFLDPLIDFRNKYNTKIIKTNSKKLVFEDFQKIWEDEQSRVNPKSLENPLNPVSFSELKPFLKNIMKSTEIFIENSTVKYDERLIYGENPGIYIVVGGNTLSRGLTLEGLIVSYFVRGASAYDTLLQMGRWFGFRNGYQDLPRIWMTNELKQYFFELATVEQEIRYDIKRYFDEEKTPMEFGVRIRTHPLMLVTTRLKMKAIKKCNISYSEKRVQTVIFKKYDKNWLASNIEATRNFIKYIDKPLKIGYDISFFPNVYGFNDVGYKKILEFLRNYQFHENSYHLRNEYLIKYIKDEVRCESLKQWNVLILSKKKQRELKEGGPIDLGLPNGIKVNPINRSQASASNGTANLKSIMMLKHNILDFLDVSGIDLKEGKLFKIRSQRLPKTGLLIIYPINGQSKKPEHAGSNSDLNAIEDIIGIGLVFPKSMRNLPDSYVVANIPEQKEIEIENEPVNGEDDE